MIVHKKSIFGFIAIIGFLIILIGSFYILGTQSFFKIKKPAIMVINIDGEIGTTFGYGIYEKRGQNRTNGTSSMNVIRMLEYFSEDDSIKAFILEINSYGGQTAGQEEIARYIKRMDKPVVAVITNKALSSGYFVAAGTDKIYASESSQIGELANTFVYVNRRRYGEEQVCHITSSNYDTITLEQCKGFDWLTFERLKSLVQGTHELLVSHIAEMRGLPQSDIKAISDGRIMTSEEALKYRLIDEIGTTYDAVNWLEKELKTKLWLIYLRDMLPTNNEKK
jgi:signal peptide peptidase SppA